MVCDSGAGNISPWWLGVSFVALTLLLSGCGGGGDNPVACGQHCQECDGDKCKTCMKGYQNSKGICLFTCSSNADFGPVVKPSNKGLAMDDNTFHWCADKMLAYWPNTNEPVTSVRLFKPWQADWAADLKQQAWESIAAFAKGNQAKVMVGTQITCIEANDDNDWSDVRKLLQILGADNVMGVSIGNELELADTQYQPECVKRIWSDGYFYTKFVDRAKDLASMGSGFETLPLTSVFGAASLGPPSEPLPFLEKPTAMVNTFFQNMTKQYASRYVFSLNVYPYFDENQHLDPNTQDQCSEALTACLCFKKPDPKDCLFSAIVKSQRDKMQRLNGKPDGTLWITETGWSFPAAENLKGDMTKCLAFSAEPAFREYYKNFLAWDLTVGSQRGPDHVFYFSPRDSEAFGRKEYFGLIGNGDPQYYCTNTTCKLQDTGSTLVNV